MYDQKGNPLDCAWPGGCEKGAVVKVADPVVPWVCQQHLIRLRDEDDPLGLNGVEVNQRSQ